jgi:hypothetical protein
VGEIKKLLAADKIPFRTITPNMIWSDLCENIHLHYRNIRFDFSHKEWAHFRAAIQMIGLSVEEQIEKSGHKEGDPNFLIQIKYRHPLKTDSKYYANRCTIEQQRDNTVHFHYRDLRLHMSNEEFREIAGLFVESLREMDSTGKFPYGDLISPETASVPLRLIQPYDKGHLPLAEDSEHRKGIEHVKLLIKQGKKIRPILVNTEGQRLDGFKRYMAFKELGHKEIECIIDPYGKMGGQHGQSFVVEE